MFFVKINISFLIFLTIIAIIQALIELPALEDNNIVDTEATIRNIVNNLFGILKIEDVKYRSRLKHFSTIHNYFVTITLTDGNNLKQIARLSRVNDADNNTEYFTTQLNEILNEKSKETNDDDIHVTKHIDQFINQLKYLKEAYVSKRNYDINEKILPYIETQHNVTNAKFTEDNNKSNDSDENLLSDNEYWQPSGRRIFRGTRTRIRSFPFIGSIQFFKKFQCAGSIIKSDLVITSASCLQLAWNNRFFRENPAFLSVQVGSTYYDGGGDNIAVIEIYFHPSYDPKSLHNNLAVMRLSRRIRFKNSRVKKIDIDKNPWALPDNTDKITVIGWGAKGRDNIVYNPIRNKLSYADLDFYPLSYCQEHYTSEFVTKKHFCAGFFSKGGGACNRDAGGPGVVDGILMGVISFGSPVCGAPDAPTVFTKLGFYADWLTEIMDQDVSYANHPTTRRVPITLPRLEKKTTHTSRTLRPILFSRRSTTTPPVPTKDVDVLRVQDEGFKDFLSTIFASDEYFGSHEIKAKEEIDDNKEDITQERERIIIKETSNTIPAQTNTEISDVKIPADEDESIESVTRKNNNVIDISEPTPEIPVSHDNGNMEESLEKDIMTLIDNLDIKELIKPESNPVRNVSNAIKQNQKNIAVEHSNESIENNIQISPKQQSVLNFLFLSEENNDKKGDDNDEDEGGLSIQTDPVSGLALRDNHNNSKAHDVLTEESLYELISLAIDEEAKRINKKKRYLL